MAEYLSASRLDQGKHQREGLSGAICDEQIILAKQVWVVAGFASFPIEQELSEPRFAFGWRIAKHVVAVALPVLWSRRVGPNGDILDKVQCLDPVLVGVRQALREKRQW
ncbi:hypothetical protein NBRC116584_29990 [Hydrogenophaga sp. 5NK40-0174]